MLCEVKYNSGIVIIDEIYWKLLRILTQRAPKAGIFCAIVDIITTIDQIT